MEPSFDATARGTPERRSRYWLLVLTALLLPLIFAPFYCFFLAPIALVPFCLCVLRRPLNWRALLAYYGLGLAFFLPNLFWLAPVTIGGLIALSFYLGIYFPLFAWGLHRTANQYRLPATLAVPLVWTAVEYARVTFLEGGFPWFPLGNCFTPVPLLLQTADLFGVWGLTFLIAMFNGFFVDLLRLPHRREGRFNPTLRRLLVVNIAGMVLVLGYGAFRLSQSTLTPGPHVAVIQENLPQSLKDDPNKAYENFQKHVTLARTAAMAGVHPDLIVWPETMVPSPINRELLTLDEATLNDDGRDLVKTSRFYDAELRDLATATGSAMLVGAPGLIVEHTPMIRQNLTLLYLPGKGQADESYSKIHIVPFGEYTPFRAVPLLGTITRYFIPIDFDYSLTPGTTWTRFHLEAGGRTYTFGTPICFEDTMPDPPRMMSFDGERKTDFLLNVSNDGWFHSVELDQHLQADQLRAVENRIPIARSVNTGDSGFVDSNGRILALVTDAKSGISTGAVGTLAMTLPLDSRVSLFSHIGDLLPIVCGIVATLLIAWTYVRPRRG